MVRNPVKVELIFGSNCRILEESGMALGVWGETRMLFDTRVKGWVVVGIRQS